MVAVVGWFLARGRASWCDDSTQIIRDQKWSQIVLTALTVPIQPQCLVGILPPHEDPGMEGHIWTCNGRDCYLCRLHAARIRRKSFVIKNDHKSIDWVDPPQSNFCMLSWNPSNAQINGCGCRLSSWLDERQAVMIRLKSFVVKNDHKSYAVPLRFVWQLLVA